MEKEVKEIKNGNLEDFLPENLHHSQLLSCINENLEFTLDDFNSTYKKNTEETIQLLKECEFLKITYNLATYEESFINCIFICEDTLLNKDLLFELREHKDINYNRFYKKNNYKWVFVPELKCKEKFVKFIKEKEIQMQNLTKNSLINNVIYSKEYSVLKDKRKNSDYSSGGSNNSSGYKWRKRSKNYCNKSGYKLSDNSGFHHKNSHNYYSNKYKIPKGRERFNSDGYSNKYINDNYYIDKNSQNVQIEVEMDDIKYPLKIDYKYSNEDIINLYEKMRKDGSLEIKPTFLVEENELISSKPKEIELSSFTSSEKKVKNAQAINNSINTSSISVSNSSQSSGNKIKIPKNNPLSQMSKTFNKFDTVPQNFIFS